MIVVKITERNTSSTVFTQSPDFYGILASWMVGRFDRKVGTSGKSHVSYQLLKIMIRDFLNVEE